MKRRLNVNLLILCMLSTTNVRAEEEEISKINSDYDYSSPESLKKGFNHFFEKLAVSPQDLSPPQPFYDYDLKAFESFLHSNVTIEFPKLSDSATETTRTLKNNKLRRYISTTVTKDGKNNGDQSEDINRRRMHKSQKVKDVKTNTNNTEETTLSFDEYVKKRSENPDLYPINLEMHEKFKDEILSSLKNINHADLERNEEDYKSNMKKFEKEYVMQLMNIDREGQNRESIYPDANNDENISNDYYTNPKGQEMPGNFQGPVPQTDLRQFGFGDMDLNNAYKDIAVPNNFGPNYASGNNARPHNVPRNKPHNVGRADNFGLNNALNNPKPDNLGLNSSPNNARPNFAPNNAQINAKHAVQNKAPSNNVRQNNSGRNNARPTPRRHKNQSRNERPNNFVWKSARNHPKPDNFDWKDPRNNPRPYAGWNNARFNAGPNRG